VDADADTRELYRRSFALAGYDVVEASDGRDALTIALVRPPTLVVTEIRLPFVDGYALCEILRRDRATSEVPILVVTDEIRPVQMNRARKAGADTVLMKPTTPDTVVNEVRRLLAPGGRPAERGQPDQPESTPVIRSEMRQRTVLARAHQRLATTTPPLAPPGLFCPSCDGALTYQRSHLGGVSDRHPEQWDYYVCPALCGTFQYRQRTRRTRRVA
jgi:DNA-binding response OmpR family regulator